jgi:CHASE2 domain-containing sensor protein
MPAAVALCRSRIVIVGGTWHEAAEGKGALIEGFESPIGLVPGVYLQANYVEALLDRRFALGVGPGWMLALDLVLALLLYYFSRLPSTPIAGIAITLMFCLLIVLCYLTLANVGVYIDGVLALVVCAGHLVGERVIHVSERS